MQNLPTVILYTVLTLVHNLLWFCLPWEKRSEGGSIMIEKIQFVKIVNTEEIMPPERQYSFQVSHEISFIYAFL